MGIYGNTAVEVVKNYSDGQDLHIEWSNQVSKFTSSKSSIEKSCPKCTFLGLCEEGLVVGIPKRKYLDLGNKNKNHAIMLYRIFKKKSELSSCELHKLYVIERGASLTNNGQADILVSLYKENLLNE
ncbi:hypothetical protein I2492_01910 [Budviciaceae bacterium CWB-B4]|uniref:Uncharacterized protein n=1 Tax=Limnobaculum xujianqingii TaxID=2738837 RepID=A0A9D7AFK2_9GAMM|nr:hypothetical protein [Limnobaculum xujianqingii]MBK5071772.1 hypothetical protein [Limnobaculum xujianqingii]MBK5175081.1 hypothetical protein [Limnobaculum xujianqingii]